MNIQLIIDFDTDILEAQKMDILNQAYMFKYILEEQIPEHLKGGEFKKLLEAFKSVDLIVRD